MRKSLNRRRFMTSTAAASLATLAIGAAPPRPTGSRRPIAVASGYGLRAVDRAVELIKKGHDPLDAAIEGVAIVEADRQTVDDHEQRQLAGVNLGHGVAHRLQMHFDLFAFAVELVQGGVHRVPVQSSDWQRTAATCAQWPVPSQTSDKQSIGPLQAWPGWQPMQPPPQSIPVSAPSLIMRSGHSSTQGWRLGDNEPCQQSATSSATWPAMCSTPSASPVRAANSHSAAVGRR